MVALFRAKIVLIFVFIMLLLLQLVSSEVDCGLRGFDGVESVHFACEDSGEVESVLRVFKDDIYGVMLVNPVDVYASDFNVMTSDGLKSLKLFVLEHCGNENIDPGEECDDGSILNGEPCDPPYAGNCVFCTSQCFNETLEGSYCGDSVVNVSYEECDNGSLNGVPCNPPAYNEDCVWCNSTCGIETEVGDYCGDGEITNPPESCDGANLAGESCEGLGYYGGALSCTGNCEFDTSNCYEACVLEQITIISNNPIEEDDSVFISGDISGNCAGADMIQVDANSSDNECHLEYNFALADMVGINSSVSIFSGDSSFIGEWVVPSISEDCEGKTVIPYDAGLWDGIPGPTGNWLTGTDNILGDNVEFGVSTCDSYGTEGDCEGDSACDWCLECLGNKSSGFPDNQCVDTGTCTYSCAIGECNAVCAGEDLDNTFCGSDDTFDPCFYGDENGEALFEGTLSCTEDCQFNTSQCTRDCPFGGHIDEVTCDCSWLDWLNDNNPAFNKIETKDIHTNFYNWPTGSLIGHSGGKASVDFISSSDDGEVIYFTYTGRELSYTVESRYTAFDYDSSGNMGDVYGEAFSSLFDDFCEVNPSISFFDYGEYSYLNSFSDPLATFLQEDENDQLAADNFLTYYSYDLYHMMGSPGLWTDPLNPSQDSWEDADGYFRGLTGTAIGKQSSTDNNYVYYLKYSSEYNTNNQLHFRVMRSNPISANTISTQYNSNLFNFDDNNVILESYAQEDGSDWVYDVPVIAAQGNKVAVMGARYYDSDDLSSIYLFYSDDYGNSWELYTYNVDYTIEFDQDDVYGVSHIPLISTSNTLLFDSDGKLHYAFPKTDAVKEEESGPLISVGFTGTIPSELVFDPDPDVQEFTYKAVFPTPTNLATIMPFDNETSAKADIRLASYHENFGSNFAYQQQAINLENNWLVQMWTEWDTEDDDNVGYCRYLSFAVSDDNGVHWARPVSFGSIPPVPGCFDCDDEGNKCAFGANDNFYYPYLARDIIDVGDNKGLIFVMYKECSDATSCYYEGEQKVMSFLIDFNNLTLSTDSTDHQIYNIIDSTTIFMYSESPTYLGPRSDPLNSYTSCDTTGGSSHNCTVTGGGCFKEGTKVYTPKGYRNIETIKAGDIVYSIDENTNSLVETRVIKPLIHKDFNDPAVRLKLSNNIEIDVTLNHAFYNPDADDYKQLKDFKVSDKLLYFNTEKNKVETVKILDMVSIGYFDLEYNLELEKPNNYLVEGILVHNYLWKTGGSLYLASGGDEHSFGGSGTFGMNCRTDTIGCCSVVTSCGGDYW